MRRINIDEPPIIGHFIVNTISWRAHNFISTNHISSDWTKFWDPNLRTFDVAMTLEMTHWAYPTNATGLTRL